MEARSLRFVAESTAGELRNANPALEIRRVITDSREVQPGDLFVALRGERVDGHDFVDAALARGAAAALVDRERMRNRGTAGALVLVSSARSALGSLAACYRRDFELPIVAVGGSNGKTTTKDLLGSVLRRRLEIVASARSFNNDIGVPLTLLSLERRHQAAVLEAGTNHPGELEPLLRMIRPRFGVITSIGREHLEFFHDMDSVAQEEGWLAEALPGDGRLFLNGDSSWADQISRRCRAGVTRVGLGPANSWRAGDITVGCEGTAFSLEAPFPELKGRYQTRLLGRHQTLNALFALAVGAELGLSREELALGLADCQPPRQRLQLCDIGDGIRVLDDSYNANADSGLAALRTLADLPCAGRRVAVLGDMAELGAQTVPAHEEIGRAAARSGVDQLFAVGSRAGITAEAARRAGLNHVFEFEEVESAAEALKDFTRPNDLILVKASRASRFERIIDALRRLAPRGSGEPQV